MTSLHREQDTRPYPSMKWVNKRTRASAMGLRRLGLKTEEDVVEFLRSSDCVDVYRLKKNFCNFKNVGSRSLEYFCEYLDLLVDKHNIEQKNDIKVWFERVLRTSSAPQEEILFILREIKREVMPHDN